MVDYDWSGGIVSTELELELQDIRSSLRFCSSSLIICSFKLIFSFISRSMVAKLETRHVSSAGFVSVTDDGTSGVPEVTYAGIFRLKM